MAITEADQWQPPTDPVGESLIDAAELERRRLERDLHDHAEPRLHALSLRLAALAARLSPGSEEADGLAAARRELDAALRDLRDVVHALHPTALGRHGLRVAIEGLAAACLRPVDVVVDVPHRLRMAVEIAAYYLVSEALANTAKHAEATTASVVVRLRDDELLVEVTDDGCGGAELTGGTGLRGLADRIALLGGSLNVCSPPGRGTWLRARIPVAPALAEPALAA